MGFVSRDHIIETEMKGARSVLIWSIFMERIFRWSRIPRATDDINHGGHDYAFWFCFFLFFLVLLFFVFFRRDREYSNVSGNYFQELVSEAARRACVRVHRSTCPRLRAHMIYMYTNLFGYGIYRSMSLHEMKKGGGDDSNQPSQLHMSERVCECMYRLSKLYRM